MVAPGTRIPTEARPTSRAAVALAVVVLIGCLVYLNALQNPFVYDDHRLILENTSLYRLFDVRAILLHDMARPFANLSFAVDYAVWGARPFGFHLTNLLLHLLNIVLLFWLARAMVMDRANRGPGGAEPGPGPGLGGSALPVAAALLLAVHPMLTESVGYVSSRSEVLCATLFLAAMLCGRRFLIDGGVQWITLTVLLWALALGVKEVAVMLPFLLLAYGELLLPDSESRRRRLRAVLGPLALLAAAFVAMRVGVLNRVEHPGDIAPDWRLGLVELDVMRRYVVLFILPLGQAVFHEVAPIDSLWTPRAIGAIVLVVGLLALAWRARRANPVLSLGLLWFLLLLLPSSALVLLDRAEPMAEHRTYLASFGLFLAAAAAAVWFSDLVNVSGRARLLTRLTGAVIIVWLAGHTVVRNATWGSPVALWVEAVRQAPTHWWPRLLLGQALQEAGLPAEAAMQYRFAISRRPQEPLPYAKLAESLAQLGRFDEAGAALEQMRKRDPNSPVPFTGLGAVAMMKGDSARAVQLFQEALKRDPLNIPARQGLARLLAAENPAEALRLCEELGQLAPESPAYDECLQAIRAAGLKHGVPPR
jgi:Flp pilus assembly protein TadD